MLTRYIDQKGVDWDVVFDARGRLTEPHTGYVVPLGTLQVRKYLADIAGHTVGPIRIEVGTELYPTRGPQNRYKGILFVEKEGFDPLLRLPASTSATMLP